MKHRTQSYMLFTDLLHIFSTFFKRFWSKKINFSARLSFFIFRVPGLKNQIEIDPGQYF